MEAKSLAMQLHDAMMTVRSRPSAEDLGAAGLGRQGGLGRIWAAVAVGTHAESR